MRCMKMWSSLSSILRSPWIIMGLLTVVNLYTLFVVVLDSSFQSNCQSDFLRAFKSSLLSRVISVSKTSPDTVFSMELVNLSISRLKCLTRFFTAQFTHFLPRIVSQNHPKKHDVQRWCISSGGNSKPHHCPTKPNVFEKLNYKITLKPPID